MQEKLKKFFENDKLFYAMPIIYLVSYLIYDGYYLFVDFDSYGLYYVFVDVFAFLAMIGITISFKKHEKNVMKGLLGGILLMHVTKSAYSSAIEYFTGEDAVYTAFNIVMSLLWLTLFINHLRLASDHKANPSTVKFNQYLVIITMIVDIAWEIYCYSTSNYAIIYSITYEVAVFAILYIVVAVETKVDMFKLFRQQKLENN